MFDENVAKKSTDAVVIGDVVDVVVAAAAAVDLVFCWCC